MVLDSSAILHIFKNVIPIHSFPSCLGGCKDQRNDCARLKARNFCKKSRDAMQKLCPATCGVCPEGSEEKTLPPPPGKENTSSGGSMGFKINDREN